ncbi:response regulator [Mariprofundus sp. KV]|uniref:response regulator n=1 Tax=Mariprofundus sp. KV TaxID=2608715 RepID=UPI0015A31C18|nr:response regulator [Mariprofundus sp. KV]
MNDLPKRLIHIVDDDACIREFMEALLERFGYDVQSFSDALTYIQHVNCDGFVKPFVTFVDVVMPYMNGYQMMAGLAPENPDMKFIIMSDGADFGLETNNLACMSLAKPFYPGSLQEVLNKLAECMECGPSSDLDCGSVGRCDANEVADWTCPHATDVQYIAAAESRLNKKLSDYLH